MKKRTIGETIADNVTYFAGSWKFIIVVTIFLIIWIVINSLAYFDFITFDKYPFILLNLILSFIAAFQVPFIMMTQNRTERKQDEAYRTIFAELKELVEQDISLEKEIHLLEHDIKKDLAELISMLKKD